MFSDDPFLFKAHMWVYPGLAAWHFVTLPVILAEQFALQVGPRRGFGSLRVEVKVGDTSWKTSIFPDKKSQSFLLPIKSEVRKKEKLDLEKEIEFELRLLDN